MSLAPYEKFHHPHRFRHRGNKNIFIQPELMKIGTNKLRNIKKSFERYKVLKDYLIENLGVFGCFWV